MRAKTVGFAIADEDRALLEDLVAEYGGGNRSEFLRYAMKKIARDRLAERMSKLQQEAREDMGGRVYTPEETQVLIKKILAS
jgi:Arc/MetJ-type ribon-helix-helix transcriptional regulator